MRFRQPRAFVVHLAAAALLASAHTASAVEVGGGGGKATDCLATLKAEVNTPAAKPRHVTCTDGDLLCDADGVVNGTCSIELEICANSTFSSSCALNGVDSITVDHALDDGLDPKFDPSFQALQNRVDSDIDLTDPAGSQLANQCTNAGIVAVPIKGPLGTTKKVCSPTRKKVKLTTLSKIISGRVYKDVDVMRLKCLPAANGCDPQALFAGTADRIQRQIYNQSCAVATCHDSESVRAGLLLEAGASQTNTVNVNPANPAALGAGWKRIAVTVQDVSGDPATSYLYHKLTGELPDASYGVRMPFQRPKLHSSLIEIVRLWILAGAPENGWVPNTD